MSLILSGMKASLFLKKRVVLLENTFLFIKALKLEIEYKNETIFKILKLSPYRKRLSFIEYCCNELVKDVSFSSAWKNGILKSRENFSADEKEKLINLGYLLGSSDLKTQSEILNLYCEYFKNFKEKAEDLNRKYGNTVFLLGILFGLAIFIMII